MIAASLFLFLGGATVSQAASPPVTTERLAEDIEKSRRRLEEEDLKRRRVLSALYDLNSKIRKTVSEKSKLQSDRESLEDNVQRLSEKLQELDLAASALRARLGERLKAIHRLGGPSLIRAFSAASSASDLDRNLKILGVIASRDRDVVREYRLVRDDIRVKRERLAGRLEKLRQVEGDLKNREQRLVKEQSTKGRILDGIRRKRLFAEKNLDELRTQARATGADEAVLDLLFRPSFADEKGRLRQPVDGAIVRRFGTEKSPDQSWMVTHKGVRFAAPAGRPVTAVFDGTVAWTGEIKGFGKAFVVDHGDHYYTVYGGAGDVLVHQGQEIRRGQVAATVGTGNEPGLYFEIRHFSEPYDPQNWLKGTSL